MQSIYNIFDKFKSISNERVNDFLRRNGIEHQCTELNKIEFRLEDWNWELYIDGNYFKMDLIFPITEEMNAEKPMNKSVAEEACLEVTKQIKVLKAFYTSHSYVDKGKDNRVVSYNILGFTFESFCYNMCDFRLLFNNAINVIVAGYREFPKFYDEIESKLPGTPIGFRLSDSNDTKEKSLTTNKHRIGFV